MGPLARRGVVSLAVRLVNVGDLRHEGIIGVGVAQQRADRKEDLRDRERGRPLVLKDVQADGAVAVDVGVVNFGGESDLRGLEGVVGRELNVQEEHALVVGRVLGAHDGGRPGELVGFVGGAG